VALLVAIRIYQIIRFGSPVAASGFILPVLVYWRASKPDTKPGWPTAPAAPLQPIGGACSAHRARS
jgi:hypothetical protein